MTKQTFIARVRHMPDAIRDIASGITLFLVTVSGTVLFGRAVDHIPFLVAFDRYVYTAINLGPHPEWLNVAVTPFNFNFLPWGGTLIPSFLYFVFAYGFIHIAIRHRKETMWAFVALIVAIIVDGYLYKIISEFVIRDRPFVQLPNEVAESAKAIWRKWPTFPSGHVRDMALYSTVLAGYAKELKIPFIVLTIWMVFTRIYLGAHYPTDALAGWALGYFVGVSILLVMKPIRARLMRDYGQKPHEQNPQV